MTNYEKYSIFELRKIARGMGIKSPTTKKHAELVKEIELNRFNNENVVKKNKGRPSKNYFLLDDILKKECKLPNDNIIINKNKLILVFNYLEKLTNALNELCEKLDN